MKVEVLIPNEPLQALPFYHCKKHLFLPDCQRRRVMFFECIHWWHSNVLHYTMRDPTEYQKVHLMVAEDVMQTLEEHPFKWKSNPRIMDVGCGDGSMTMDVWRKYMPDDVRIVGSDKEQLCVDYAKKNYESDRVQFIKLNIEEPIPIQLRGNFDHVISSFVFHWVNLQETAFKNVYDMLTEDGSCILIFLGYAKPFEIYRRLSRSPKWREELKNIETKFLSPYHDSKDPKSDILSIMQRVGFRDIDVKLHHKTFDYPNGVDDFKLLMRCLNPFEGLKKRWDEFMDDYVQLDPQAGTLVYQLLVVRGCK